MGLEAGMLHACGIALLSGVMLGSMIVSWVRSSSQERTVRKKMWSEMWNVFDDILFLMDDQGTIIDINQAGQIFFQKELKEVIGKKCYELFHQTTYAPRHCVFHRQRNRKEQTTFQFYEAIQDRYFSVKCIPVYQKGETFIGYIHAMRDITSLKRAEEMEHERQEQYKILLDNVHVGIFRIETEFPFALVQCNEAFETITGYGGRDSQVDTAMQFMTEEKSFRQFVSDVIERTTNYTREFTVRRKDGALIWVSCTGKASRRKPGGVTWIDGVIEDITIKKIMHERMRTSEERHRTIFENIPCGIAILNAQGDVVSVNQQFKSWFTGPYTKVKCYDVFPCGEMRTFCQTCHLKKTLQRAEPYKHTCWKKVHGEPREFVVNTIPMGESDGKVNEVLVVIEDCTQQRTVEELQKKMLLAMHDRIKEISCMYAVTKAISTESDVSRMLQAVVECIPQGWRYAHQAHAYIRWKDAVFYSGKRDRSTACLVSPLCNNGEEEGEVGVFYYETFPPLEEGPFLKAERDLLDMIAHTIEEAIQKRILEDTVLSYQTNLEHLVRNRTEEAYRAQKVAEEANRAKSEFLANISHELRTPLHTILNFAKFGIQRAPEGNQERLLHYFHETYSAGERLFSLVSELLDLSKMELGKALYQKELIDSAVIAHSVILECTAFADAYGVSLEFMRPESPLYVMADAEKLGQVMRNVIVNAIKYSLKNGRVTISLQEENEYCHLMVIDRGIGVPEHELEKIFGSFVQSSRTKTGAGGTGLGLAIAKSIVEGHGGRIWAELNQGGGTIIHCLLPRYERSQVHE